ncbi:MAG: GntR family transcriptional regulator [Candidatus Omnitrophica bacterium]|nr:GntR family transcriptional regulator [Candidatus Omnitrophota bacterium]
MIRKNRFRIIIDRDSPTPTYQQLYDQIVQCIESDDFHVGEYLPTEHEICELSGLSRMTVRKAMDRLNQMGLVNAVRGRGTFIASKETSADSKTSIGFALRPQRYIEEDPFYSQVLLGVTREAQKRRIHLAFISGEQVERGEQSLARNLSINPLAGLMIAGQMPQGFLTYIQQLHIPCIFLNYRSHLYPFDSVAADQREIGRLLAHHLLDLGHERCLYLSGEADNIAYEERLAGFQEIFQTDSKRQVYVLKGCKHSESGRMMIQTVLKKRVLFSCVAAGNDMIAIGAMNELQDRGIQVPQDVSVCGIDNVSFSENSRPSLTTVHIEKHQMGVKALQILMDRIQNPTNVQQTILLGVKLCIRQSTGPAPANLGEKIQLEADGKGAG